MLFYIRKLLSYIFIFFKKGALSDKDIKKLLGKHIYIYPFEEDNLKGGSYNLTASRCAIIKEDEKEQLIIYGDEIIIPAGKTGIIETNECILVSRWITGTYHSKVKMVNKGLGHIGTTLDPDFFGVSAIALHNVSNHDIKIKYKDTIATIMFDTLRSLSSGNNDNMTGHFNELHFDTIDFYPNINNKKAKNIITVLKNDVEIHEKITKMNILLSRIIHENKDTRRNSTVIYNVGTPVCDNCKVCSKKDKCSFKLLKNINAEEEKREQTIKAIKEWRNQPWITSRRALKKLVIEEVKIRDTIMDIIIWGILWFAVGIIIMVGLFIMVTLERFKGIKDPLNSFLAGIPSAIVIIIGWFSSYKMYCKKEYEKKKENKEK